MKCKIGKRIIRNYKFLKEIATANSKKKLLHLLSNASRDELLSIVEIAFNILSGNFCIEEQQKLRLFPHASSIRKLAYVKSERGARGIIQKGEGSFLPALLIPVLVEVVRHYLNR